MEQLNLYNLNLVLLEVITPLKLEETLYTDLTLLKVLKEKLNYGSNLKKSKTTKEILINGFMKNLSLKIKN